jgi:hypothetical protein
MGVLILEPFMSAKEGVELRTEPELGEHIAVPRRADVGRCMSSPGQLDKCVKVSVNGISYIVGYRKRGVHGNIVTYVHTDDPRFRSPEGLRVGVVATVDSSESLIAAPGWEIYGRKGWGWIPVVGFSGQVDVIREGQADEKRLVAALNPSTQRPVHLRIRGFTKRGHSSGSKDRQQPTALAR